MIKQKISFRFRKLIFLTNSKTSFNKTGFVNLYHQRGLSHGFNLFLNRTVIIILQVVPELINARYQ